MGAVRFKGGTNSSVEEMIMQQWERVGNREGRPWRQDGPTGWKNKWNSIFRSTDVRNRGR